MCYQVLLAPSSIIITTTARICSLQISHGCSVRHNWRCVRSALLLTTLTSSKLLLTWHHFANILWFFGCSCASFVVQIIHILIAISFRWWLRLLFQFVRNLLLIVLLEIVHGVNVPRLSLLIGCIHHRRFFLSNIIKSGNSF